MLFLLRYPAALLGAALGLLVGIVLHSAAQAAVARASGDRMAATSGRLSLDPRRHFEPFGIIVMLIAGIGWNKPVPLQEPRFRGGRGRYFLAVIVGPLTNLLLGVLALVALRFLLDVRVLVAVDPIPDLQRFTFAAELVFAFMAVNTLVGVLTILPIPPLDGARILWLYAPQTTGWRTARYHLEERNIGVGIVLLLSLPLFGNAYGLITRLAIAIAGAFLAPIAQGLGIDILF